MMDTHLTDEERRSLAMKALRNAQAPFSAAQTAIDALRETERRTGLDLDSEHLGGIREWWAALEERGLLDEARISRPE